MLRRWVLLIGVLCLCAVVARAETKRPRYEVVGYVMARGRAGVLDPSSIAAGKLTRINYAFFVLKDGAIAERSDHDDDNVKALVGLKKTNPQLQVLISVGGGSSSGGFSEMAFTAEGRKKFVDSAMAVVEKFDLDGIDVDWEYPGYTHTPGMHVRPEDKQSYTLLMKDLRLRFDKEEKRLKRPLVTSSATGATQIWLDHTDMRSAAKWLTSVNMMCYDWYYEDAKNTGHDSPLYTSAADPSQISIDNAVKLNLAAGVPRRKLVIGVPFYGRKWPDVGAPNNGLWQPVNGGTTLSFKDIVPLIDAQGNVRHWDSTAKAPYLYNAEKKTFITYNDAQAETERTAYVKKMKLGGMMFWEYNDDPDNVLLDAIVAGFKDR